MVNNVITIGRRNSPILTLENETITSCIVSNSIDPICSELPINTAEIDIRFLGAADIFCPKDSPDGMITADDTTVYCLDDTIRLDNLPYATEIHIDSSGKNIGFYYLKSVRKTGFNSWKIEAVNYVGLLDVVQTKQAYALDGTPVRNMALDILGKVSGLSARLATSTPGDYETPKEGFITCMSAREALQTLCMACGVIPMELSDDTIVFKELQKVTTGVIEPSNIYNSGSIEYVEQVRSITISEYVFMKNTSYDTDDWDLLFDNTETYASATDEFEIIDTGIPWDTYTYSGLVILAAANGYFKVRGKGTIKVRRYLYTKHDRTSINSNVTLGEEITLDSYAVSELNCSAIMRRLEAYYFADRRVISCETAWNGEMCGLKYDTTSPTKEITSGYMNSMVLSLSGVTKANCCIETGWTPKTAAQYSTSVLLTGSGTWVVPDGVDAFNVVLIGGGSGGQSGLKGPNGTNKWNRVNTTTVNYANDPGECGQGGKILSITVYNPGASYKYSCGAGGSGGALCSSETVYNNGNNGVDTTFGVYTSADGYRSDSGYKDPLTENVYAAKMVRGDDCPFGWNYSAGYTVKDIDSSGGYNYTAFPPKAIYGYYQDYKKRYPELTGTTPKGSTKFTVSDGAYFYALHGSAGGFGANTAGKNGADSKMGSDGKVHLGNGGDGATPSVAGIYPLDINRRYYGWGGAPGYPGGAGGNSGFIAHNNSSWIKDYVKVGTGGTGGKGGKGGNGAPGCIIIYY